MKLEEDLDEDVLLDLIALVDSGDASPATVTLVDRLMRSNPRLARLREQAAEARFEDEDDEPLPASEDLELRALNLTKERLRRRSIFLALALFFSFLPFTFVVDSRGLSWVWLGQPALAVPMLLIAGLFWFLWWRIARGLRDVGV